MAILSPRFTSILIVLSVLTIHEVECLSCYQCTSTDSVLHNNCPKVTCQQGEMCYLERQMSGNGSTVLSGRCEKQLCNEQHAAIIGRMLQSRDIDGRCCSTDYCNGCHDDPNVNCEPLKSVICNSMETAKTLCPFTCNLCATQSSDISTTTTTTTTSHVVTAKTTTARFVPTSKNGFWLEWSSPACQSVDGICFSIRRRMCSTNDAPDCPGIDYDSELCSASNCHSTTKATTTPKSETTTTATTTTPPTTTTTNKPKPTTGTSAYFTTTTPSSCEDSDHYNCNLVKDVVCHDKDLMHYCNRTCGLCGYVLTTPPSDCEDSGRYKCNLVKEAVCHDNDLMHDCNRTCGLCVHGTITPAYDCEDSSRFNCNLVKEVVCHDNELMHFCNRTCALCASCADTISRCAESDYQSVVCGDPSLAARYCPKTCKLC